VKLNLLPKIVDTTGRAKRAFFGGVLVLVVSIVAAFLMASISAKRVQTAKDSVADATPKYDKAVKAAADADAMMTKPVVKQLVVNTALAKAMTGANRLYPDLFDFVKPYIPAFFRITSLGATPIDEKTCTVNMTGTIKNAQQYADLVLALLRIPGASAVTRAGFQSEDLVVPAITVGDQIGHVRLESKAPIPDDPLERLAYFQSETSPTGYLNAGNFGNLEAGTEKGARPGESLIAVSVVIPRNIQTPNPRATIQSLAGGNATPAAGGTTQASAPLTPPAGQKTRSRNATSGGD
jgi:hypothetical protein